MNKIYVAGIGPGTEDYLLPITKKIVSKSDVLIGGQRALDLFAESDKEKIKITANLEEIKDYIIENYKQQQIVVLVSGDPGLYSMLSYLKRYFVEDKLEVIPGVSALQLGFAKGKMVWQDAKITSLHGSDNRQKLVKLVKEETKVGFFTDQQFPPQEIAKFLLEQGVTTKQGLVAENLAYSSERMIRGSLIKLSQEKFGGLSVMVIYDE
ncbi:hypothetical protein JCM16358_23510 [Halanaerocella petrolearia]